MKWCEDCACVYMCALIGSCLGPPVSRGMKQSQTQQISPNHWTLHSSWVLTYLSPTHTTLSGVSCWQRDRERQRGRVGGKGFRGGGLRPFLPLCCLPLPGGDRGELGRNSNRRRGERWFREEPVIICVLGWGWGDLSYCFARRMARPIIQLEVKGESMVGWMFSPQLNSRPTHRSLNPFFSSSLPAP